jgi:glycosyltransferase involved in cell wall biosynthesis
MHVIHSLRRGGAERLVLQMATHFKKSGHECIVVTLIDVNEYQELCDDIDIYSLSTSTGLGKWPFCVPEYARRLSKAIRSFNPDVIECHLPTASLVTAFGRKHVPAVRMIHSQVVGGAWRWVEMVGLRLLKKNIVAVSPSVAEDVKRKLKISSVTTILNGIDLPCFPFRENIVHGDKPIICTLGTICKSKRPDLAIKAFYLLQKKFPNAVLKFIGDGPLKTETEEKAHRLGISGQVIFTGQVNNVSEELKGVNVLWQLSENEGFGLSIVEAMSSGIPVVAHDVIGIRDVVVDGRVGYLVSKGNTEMVAEKTIQILLSKNLLQKMSSAAREHAVKNFSIRNMAEQHLDMLQRVSKNCTQKVKNRGH